MKHVNPLFTLRWSYSTALRNHAASRVPSRAKVISRRPHQMRRTINHFERIWAVVTCAECSSMVTCSFFFPQYKGGCFFISGIFLNVGQPFLWEYFVSEKGVFLGVFTTQSFLLLLSSCMLFLFSPFFMIRSLDWCRVFSMRAMGLSCFLKGSNTFCFVPPLSLCLLPFWKISMLDFDVLQ